MKNLLETYFPFVFPIFFPVFFALVWLGVTTLLGFLSGWYALMQQYPDREDRPFLRLTWLSGQMGLVAMRGVLNVSVCPAGLRIGMLRAFGIFSRDFFVPWGEIKVARKDWLLGQRVELTFGNPPIGKLNIPAVVADQLAAASLGRWPKLHPAT